MVTSTFKSLKGLNHSLRHNKQKKKKYIIMINVIHFFIFVILFIYILRV